MTILVVEDDPIVLSLVDRMLTLNGHTVLAAEDADQARSPKVLRSGLGPVLHKPFTADALLKAIDGL
ncbi:MAG TPA: hypothetical protein VGJ78_18055 [Vicinamibacterales bacterium]|jgi:hypothetical protein